jgi:hypothetical protein
LRSNGRKRIRPPILRFAEFPPHVSVAPSNGPAELQSCFAIINVLVSDFIPSQSSSGKAALSLIAINNYGDPSSSCRGRNPARETEK